VKRIHYLALLISLSVGCNFNDRPDGAPEAGTTGGSPEAGTTGGAPEAGTTGGVPEAGTTGGALPYL